jgi:predicted HicB family RNase H-like nuclease
MKKDPKSQDETTVLNLRDMPLALVANLKAAAAFERMSLKKYVAKVLQGHVEELQKKGGLPKGKG